MKEAIRKALLDYGCRLAWLRESFSLTAAQVGDRAGFGVGIVEQIERGELSATLEQLRALAGVLGVSMSELFNLDTHGASEPEEFDHALLVGNVVRALGCIAANTSCVVLPPGVAVAFPRADGLTWPDVVVAHRPRTSNRPSWLIEQPIVILEVMTAGSEQHDRGLKFQGYRTFASLLDYVTVDASKASVEHHTRIEHDAWRLRVHGPGDHVQLGAVLGAIAVDEIYRGVSFDENPG